MAVSDDPAEPARLEAQLGQRLRDVAELLGAGETFDWYAQSIIDCIDRLHEHDPPPKVRGIIARVDPPDVIDGLVERLLEMITHVPCRIVSGELRPCHPGWWWRYEGQKIGWVPYHISVRASGHDAGSLVHRYGVVEDDGRWGGYCPPPAWVTGTCEAAEVEPGGCTTAGDHLAR